MNNIYVYLIPGKSPVVLYVGFIYIQLNLSYVTFQENIEIDSHKTGGHLIQV